MIDGPNFRRVLPSGRAKRGAARVCGGWGSEWPPRVPVGDLRSDIGTNYIGMFGGRAKVRARLKLAAVARESQVSCRMMWAMVWTNW
jgi:hypothetical protein